MKKFNRGLLALALTVGIAGAFASSAPKPHSGRFTTLYWYSVNPSTNETVGPYDYHDTKANVIAEQACDDSQTTICLFGSTSPSLPTGTNVGSPAPADRINENKQ